jgi:CheY-like chemotaxis protein
MPVTVRHRPRLRELNNLLWTASVRRGHFGRCSSIQVTPYLFLLLKVYAELSFPCADRLSVRIGVPASSLSRTEGDAFLPHTILIVDDNAAIRTLIRSTIEKNTDWNSCGEAENGAVAVQKVRDLHPEIVFLDLQMPVMNGLEAARQINIIAPKTQMLMFTMHNSQQLLRDARAAGIKDVISKTDAPAAQILAFLKPTRN